MTTRSEVLTDIVETMNVMRRAMHVHFQDAFDSVKLSPSQLRLLLIISVKQPISHKELAKKIQLTPGAVTQLLDGLDAERYIVRNQSEADRRINYLSITKLGKQKLAEFNKLQEHILTKAFSTLELSELQSYQLVQHKILDYFENHSQPEKRSIINKQGV